jgi:hypothetical protein
MAAPSADPHRSVTHCPPWTDQASSSFHSAERPPTLTDLATLARRRARLPTASPTLRSRLPASRPRRPDLRRATRASRSAPDPKAAPAAAAPASAVARPFRSRWDSEADGTTEISRTATTRSNSPPRSTKTTLPLRVPEEGACAACPTGPTTTGRAVPRLGTGGRCGPTPRSGVGAGGTGRAAARGA